MWRNERMGGRADGCGREGGAGAAQVEEPMRDKVVDFIYLTRAQRDDMLKLLPAAFFGETVPKDKYTNQSQDVNLFSLNTYVLTRPDVADDVAYKVAKSLFDNNKELASYHGTAGSWTAERAVQNPALPFHPGVIRYFKEKGSWNDALEAKQKSLLKR